MKNQTVTPESRSAHTPHGCTPEQYKAISEGDWPNPASKFVNQPGHWTMTKQWPYLCVHCGKDYNQHNPWPELPCPDPTREEREARIRAAAPALYEALEAIVSRCPMCNSGEECQDNYCYKARAALALVKGGQ